MATQVASIFAKIGADTSGLEQGLNRAKSSMEGFGSVIAKIGAAVAAAFAIKKIVGFGVSIVQEAMDAENKLVELNAVIASTRGVSGMTADAVLDIADSLSKLTPFADDAIVAGESMLLTFTNIGKNVFPQAAEAMLNMAQKFGSIESASIQLGKALNDPIEGVSALRRVGVMLTDQQEASIKGFMRLGDVASAQKVILGELEIEFGGLARAMGETTLGKITILKNTFDNLKETFGTAFLPLISSFATMFTGAAQSLTPWLEGMSMQIKNWAINAAADFFFWGANMVQSLANGIAGSNAVVSALNQIGSYFTYMLKASSPPRLLPELTDWGSQAMNAYLEGWTGGTVGGTAILKDWSKSLAPLFEQISKGGGFTDEMRAGMAGKYGTSSAVLEEYVASFASLKQATDDVAVAQKEYDDIKESGDEEGVKSAETKLGAAKKFESQEKARVALARSRVRAEAEMRNALTNAINKQTQAIQSQQNVMSDAAAKQAEMVKKQLDAARLIWQMAQADTAGKIKLIEAESAKHAEGSLEWYQFETQKIGLQQQLQNEQEAAAKAAEAEAKRAASADKEAAKYAITGIEAVQEAAKKITMPDFLDPAIMKMSKNENLWTLITNLGASLGNGFIDKFLKIILDKLKLGLGLDKDATLMDIVVTAGTKVGTAVGIAMYDAIMAKLRQIVIPEPLTEAERRAINKPVTMGQVDESKRLPSFPPGIKIPGFAYASGFNGLVTSPRLFLAGEAGPERVQVTPLGKGTKGGNNLTFNIYTSDPRAAGDAVLMKLRATGLA